MEEVIPLTEKDLEQMIRPKSYLGGKRKYSMYEMKTSEINPQSPLKIIEFGVEIKKTIHKITNVSFIVFI